MILFNSLINEGTIKVLKQVQNAFELNTYKQWIKKYYVCWVTFKTGHDRTEL